MAKKKAIKKKAPAKKKKPSKVKQTAIDLQTGKQVEVDAEELGIGDDDDEEEENLTSSQASIAAELTGIVLKPSSRVWAMKVLNAKMIERLTDIFKHQKVFMLKFRVPVEIDNGEVTNWKNVEFETTLMDIKLQSGKATCHGHIDHKGACAMSDLIQNWNGQMQFFLDGMQQAIF